MLPRGAQDLFLPQGQRSRDRLQLLSRIKHLLKINYALPEKLLQNSYHMNYNPKLICDVISYRSLHKHKGVFLPGALGGVCG